MAMGKVLLTTDWHLNSNPRDAYRHDWQRELCSVVADNHVDTVAFLGDLTDDKDNHSAALVNKIIDHLSNLRDKCAHIYFLRGNHDYVNPDCPFFQFIEAMPGFSWINTPQHLRVPGLGGRTALFLPHTHDYERDWHDVPFDRDADVIFAHNTFAGTISESGKQLTGIPTSVFPKGVPVYSGDIHIPQEVGPVTYVGSPYTVDFGDDYQPRVLILNGTRVQSIPCSGTQKRLIEATSAKHALRRLGNISNKDIVKLRVAVADRTKWKATKQWLLDEASKLGVRVLLEPVLEQQQPRTGKRYRVEAARRDDEVFADYCAALGVPEDLAKAGMRYVRPVKE